MAEKSMSDTSRAVKNPLLSAAGSGFPFENFSGSALLMPVSQSGSSVVSEGEHALCNMNFCDFLYCFMF
jgi:hypothetical protein